MSSRFRFNKASTIFKMVVTDLLLTGFGLVVFAYFHHVRNDPMHPVVLSVITPAPAVSEKTASTPAPQLTDPVLPEHSDPEISGTGSGEPETSVEVYASPSSTPSPSDEPVHPDASVPYPDDLLNGTHEDLFSSETILSDRSYSSNAVSFTIDRISVDDITFFIADIWIRDIRSFRTAVAAEYFDTNKTQALEIYKQTDALIAISGDYFSYRKTNNIAVRNGMEWIRKEPIDSDILILYYDGTMEVAYSDDRPDLDAIYAKNPYQIWCFGPILIDDYELPRSYNTTVPGPNPRCAIGYYRPGHYCFLVADGRQKGYSKGMTMRDLSDVFLQLGCRYAFNLDGGATAVMMFNGNQYSHPKNGTSRVVSDIIYIREPE